MGIQFVVVAERTGQLMPKSLKLYIAGVVALSAVALVAATLVFPAGRADRAPHPIWYREPDGDSRLLLGVAFWTLLTLITSALPVKLPAWLAPRRVHGSDHRCHDTRRTCRGRLGCRDWDHRDERAAWAHSLVWHPGEPCRSPPSSRSLQGPSDTQSSMQSLPNGEMALGRRFRGSDDRGSDLLLAKHAPRWRSSCSPDWPVPGWRDRRGLQGNRVQQPGPGAAGLADVDRLQHPVVGHAAVRPAAVHDPHGVAAVRRDARDVHADDRRARRRPSTSAIRSPRSTATGSRRSRSTSGA